MEGKVEVECRDHRDDRKHLVKFKLSGKMRPASRHSPRELPDIDVYNVPPCMEEDESPIHEKVGEELLDL